MTTNDTNDANISVHPWSVFIRVYLWLYHE